jgi:hypothetical protein
MRKSRFTESQIVAIFGQLSECDSGFAFLHRVPRRPPPASNSLMPNVLVPAAVPFLGDS